MPSSTSQQQRVVVGVTAAAVIAATLVYTLAKKKKKDNGGVTLLVFSDGGAAHTKTNGLQPNATTIYGLNPVDGSLRLDFVQHKIAKELGVAANGIRVWVQSTKKEITTTASLQSVVANRNHNGSMILSSIALICTQDRAELSSEAAASVPLDHFNYTTSVRDLSLFGLGHKLAFKGRNEFLPLNAVENLFTEVKDGPSTLLIKRPPYTENYKKYYPDIDYNPNQEFGFCMSVDPYLIAECLGRQSDFPKMWTDEVEVKIQEYTGLGLFSNSSTDTTWKTGHGVLPKFFNAIKIKNYYPLVLDKTQSFIQQWIVRGNHTEITDVNDWLTCMTADAVCKAAMDYDMRNVERKGAGEALHPFIQSFRYCVATAKGKEFDSARYEKEKLIGREFINDVVERTRAGEIGGSLSFITGMLERTSTTNGEYVNYSTFEGHCINLMIAGHETTAGTLAFCLAQLAQHPECMAKVMKEIEDVLGQRASPTYSDLTKLVYIEACFREALRLYAPVASTGRDVTRDTIVLGNRLLRRGQRIQFLFWGLHRNPEQWDQGVFGDVNNFNPDRHLPDAPSRHPNAQAYFGFGVRACIGSQFAMLEAKTFISMLLNFFTIKTPADYKIIPYVGKAFTASPKGLSFKLSYRAGGPLDRLDLFNDSGGDDNSTRRSARAAVQTGLVAKKKDSKPTSGKSVLILYGSNTGTCEEFANLLAESATEDGYTPVVMTLDQAVDKLPNTENPVLILSSTYNGTPPDNAGKFNSWMNSLKEGSLKGMRFAVFGVGNSNWESTYQKFPTDIHSCLESKAATQMKELTTSDASTSSFADVYEEWVSDIFGIIELDSGAPLVVKKKKVPRRLAYVKIIDANPALIDAVTCEKDLYQKISNVLQDHLSKKEREDKSAEYVSCEVTKTTQLQSEYSARSTCHFEISLNPKVTYVAGDHLVVLCCNNEVQVNAALHALNLKGDEVVECNPGMTAYSSKFPKDLPGIPLTARLALTWLPDLAASPTRKVLNSFAEKCPCPPEAAGLRDLADEKNYADKVLKAKLDLSDILVKYRSLEIDIEEFCGSLPRVKPRYYSISSSPLVSSTRAAITVGLVEFKTQAGTAYKGSASGMIHSLKVGDHMFARVHALNTKFKLPKDLSTPVIMVGPGTGVAPFMGFLEERDALIKQGKTLGPAHLFFGCRSSDSDFIYKDQLEGYAKNGALSANGLHVAFSREEGQSKEYVQDLIINYGQELYSLLDKGGIVYICGDAKRMAPGVKAAFVDVAAKQQGMPRHCAVSWMDGLMSSDRYLEDVYA